MARLKRADAGRRVGVLAGALSDALLGLEAKAQVEAEAKFVTALSGPAAKVVAAASKKGLPAALRDNDQARLGLLAVSVLRQTIPVYRDLLSGAADLALKSIEQELVVCERTIDKRYSGAAGDAARGVLSLVEPRAAQIADVYSGRFAEWQLAFDQIVVDDWRASNVMEEDAEMLARRVFSTEYLKAPGHSGRGDWWKPFQWAVAEMRGGEFILVNEIRRQVMADWNRAVIRRG